MLGLKLALAASAVGGAAAEVKYSASDDTCAECYTGLVLTGNTCAATGKACVDGVCKTTAASKALNAVATTADSCIEGELQEDVNGVSTDTVAQRTKCMKVPTVVATTGKCTPDGKQKCPNGEFCVNSTSPGNTFASAGTCKALSATRVPDGTAQDGSCTVGMFYKAGDATDPTADSTACKDGSTCGADGTQLTHCKAWAASGIAADAPCRTEKTDGSGSGCVADHYCKTMSGKVDPRDGKTWMYGTCKAQTATAGPSASSHTAACKSPLVSTGGYCVTLPTTAVAVAEWKKDANKACPAALEVFQQLQGNGLNWEKAVPSFKGNCAQITYDATKGTTAQAFSVAHPPSQPGTKSSSSAKAECGYCSDACVTAAAEAKKTCDLLLATGDNQKFRYWTVLPIFTAIDKYLGDAETKIQVMGVDPCAKDAKVSTGCSASTARAADVTAPSTATVATVKEAAKITEWTTKCAVAYGSGGAGQQFASSLAVLVLSALAIFA